MRRAATSLMGHQATSGSRGAVPLAVQSPLSALLEDLAHFRLGNSLSRM